MAKHLWRKNGNVTYGNTSVKIIIGSCKLLAVIKTERKQCSKRHEPATKLEIRLNG